MGLRVWAYSPSFALLRRPRIRSDFGYPLARFLPLPAIGFRFAVRSEDPG